MRKSEEKTLLFALLPSSIKEEPVFKHSSEALYAGDDSKDHLNDGLFYYRLDELDSATLDHLAAQWHSHVWRDSWSIDTKRAILKSLIKTKSHLGTKGAVKDVVSSLVGGNASIKEWFETTPQGTPHTFEIRVTQNISDESRVSSDVLTDLINGINYAKPVRSQYTLVLVNQPLKAEADFSTALRLMSYTHFYTNPTLWVTADAHTDFSACTRSLQYALFYTE